MESFYDRCKWTPGQKSPTKAVNGWRVSMIPEDILSFASLILVVVASLCGGHWVSMMIASHYIGTVFFSCLWLFLWQDTIQGNVVALPLKLLFTLPNMTSAYNCLSPRQPKPFHGVYFHKWRFCVSRKQSQMWKSLMSALLRSGRAFWFVGSSWWHLDGRPRKIPGLEAWQSRRPAEKSAHSGQRGLSETSIW